MNSLMSAKVLNLSLGKNPCLCFTSTSQGFKTTRTGFHVKNRIKMFPTSDALMQEVKNGGKIINI